MACLARGAGKPGEEAGQALAATVLGLLLEKAWREHGEQRTPGKVDVDFLERFTGAGQGGADRRFQRRRCAVGAHDHGPRVARAGDGAAPRHGVVDQVEARRAGLASARGAQRVPRRPLSAVPGPVPLVAVEPAHQIVEPGEQLVRLQVQVRQGVHRCAQPSRRRGGLYAVAGRTARDEGHPRSGQGYRVDPVAARARVHVRVRHVESMVRGERARTQGVSQGGQGMAFPQVPTGVVEARRRAQREFSGQGQIVAFEGPALSPAAERGQPEGAVLGEQRDEHQRVDLLRGRPQAVQRPLSEGGLRIDHARFKIGEGLRGGHRRQGALLIAGRPRLRVVPGPACRPAQHGVAPYGTGFEVLSREYRLHHLHGHAVGQPRHGHLREAPNGVEHIEGGADPGAGPREHLQPFLRQVAVGDVDSGVGEAQEPAPAVVQGEDGSRVDVVVLGVSWRVQVLLDADDGLSRGEHLFHHALHGLRGEAGPHFRGTSADGFRDGGALHAFGRGVEPDDPQIGIEEVQTHGGHGEECLQQGSVECGGRARLFHRGEGHRPPPPRLAVALGVDGQPAGQEGTVLTAQWYGDVADGGERVRGGSGAGEQVGHRPAHHGTSGMAQQLLGRRTPLDHRAPLVHDQVSLAPRRDVVVGVTAVGGMRCTHGDQLSLASELGTPLSVLQDGRPRHPAARRSWRATLRRSAARRGSRWTRTARSRRPSPRRRRSGPRRPAGARRCRG